MKQSKLLKTIVFALLLLWSTTNAQDPRTGNEQPTKAADEIPELQEWWRAPDDIVGLGRSISFLPNFYNGQNSIAVQVSDYTGMAGEPAPQFHTWLNRFPGDTQNVFSWKAGNIKRGDFNADGKTDYIDGEGNIYRGVENGQPPQSEPVAKYEIYGILAIYDFNRDGFDDVYTASTGVLYGGSDLTKLVKSSSPQFPLIEGDLATFYKTPQGEFRFIMRHNRIKAFDGYKIYRATWTEGGITPTFEQLDSISRSLFGGQEYFYIGGMQTFYQSKHHNKTYFFAVEKIDNDNYKKNLVIFDVSNDRFTETLRFRKDGLVKITTLHQSIDDDKYEDWTFVSQGFRYFLSGGIILDSIVRFKYKGDCFGGNLIEAIDDVDDDGINDMLISANANGIPNCFRIVKGRGLPSSINSSENGTAPFSIEEPSPHPLTPNSIAQINIAKSSNYTLKLYSAQGKEIAVITEGFLEARSYNFPIEIRKYNLAAGSYILRLSNGNQSVERTVIITN